MEGMIVKNKGPVRFETAAHSSNNEVYNPDVSETNANVELLDWELTNCKKAECTTDLGTRCVVSLVEVGAVNWARNVFR